MLARGAESSVAELIARLRELTGLSMGSLADVLGVTRTMVYRYLHGAVPHQTTLEHLLTIMPLLEEAAERLGWGASLGLWLLTPTRAGGRRPLDYLREHEYDTFRGYVLYVRPPDWARPKLSPDELAQRLDRLSPHTYAEDVGC